LFVLEGRAHRIVGKATSSYISEELKQDIFVKAPSQFYVWDEIMPEVAIGIEQDRKGGEMFMFIIMLMVLLGTVNTLIMSVFERTREFGVMKALGTPRLQIVSMVFWEAAWMSVLGVGLGVAFGTGLVEYMAIDGLKMFDEPIEFGGLQLLVIYPMNTVLGTVVYPACIVVASIMGASWPAWRASNLDPSLALREY
jgi:ABC-type lipoprotein release transport system permease subunit